MTTTNIIPNAVSSNIGPFVVTGAANVIAALTDASDSSHDQNIANPAYMILDCTTFTLPTGAVVTATVVKWRAAWVASGASALVSAQIRGDYTASPLTASPADYSRTQPINCITTQADLDSFQLFIGTANYALPAGTAQQFRVHEASVDVTYALVPTTAVSAPTGTVTTTTSPTAAWTHTAGLDALSGQTAYQIRVFTAAQYGAGGFNPATSTAFYDSGIVASSASSAPIGPLDNSTTYRAYVRTAQSTLGTYQWAAYAFSGFSVSLTTSDITSVVATALSSTARNQIVVTRNGATPLWTSVEVQKSYDAGATWTYVRGYTRFAPPSSPFTLYDYEAPNGTAAVYRARATYQVSGLDVTGAWVTSSAATWTSASDWLKDIRIPARNVTVRIVSIPTRLLQRAQGRFTPLGRTDPVVVSDVRRLATGTITFVTISDSEATALELLTSTDVLLLQTPATDRWGSKFIAIGDVQERRALDLEDEPTRYWDMPFAEILAPADTGIS